jgi:hypothetical protein
MSRQNIVTILSTNFSGSHFLSQLLGSHHRARHGGEIKYLRREHRARSCLICPDPMTCPLIKGVSHQTIQDCYRLILTNFQERGEEVQTLIDTSKKVKWARQFLNREDYDYRYIHLLRDPRALVRRWTNSLTTTRQIWHTRYCSFRRSRPLNFKALLGNWTEVLIQKWLNENRGIDHFCSAHALPVLTVTYRDLCHDTLNQAYQITRFLGLDDDPNILNFWQPQHHGSVKHPHNRSRGTSTAGYHDLRWKQDLSEQVVHYITEHPQILAYLELKNLMLLEDGLSQRVAMNGDEIISIRFPGNSISSPANDNFESQRKAA